MPQPRANPKKASRTTSVSKASRARKQASQKALTAEQLFERAQAALAFDHYEAAVECFKDALQLEPENLEVLDAYGALLAEIGQTQEAIEVLQQAVSLSPSEGFEKYMYLGQLLESREEAIAATTKGVELLQEDYDELQQMAVPSSSSSAALAADPLSSQLCSALCSLAEMHMAAAEDVAEVAEAVGQLLQRAKAVNPESPEPLQALASLKYEQGQSEEALALLKQGMALWFKPQDQENDKESEEEDEEGDEDLEFKVPKKPTTMSEDMDTDHETAAAAREGVGDGSEDWEEEEAAGPSYEFRFEAAKLLLELDESTDTAIEVLEDLIAENDSVPDVWHLLGLAYYSGGHLEEAEEVAKTGVQLLQKQGQEPEADITACFSDLQSAIAEAKAAAEEAGQAAS